RDARLSVGTKGAEEYPIQARTGQFRESNKHFFIKDAKNPYVEDKPFTWIQGDQVGGKSLIWGRQVYRWSDLDFEANLRDGHGVDWPIRYADIAPWYSYVERSIGVSGEKLGLPQLPDGEFQPPMEMNAGEKLVKAGVEKAFPGRHVTIGRVAILTQPLNGRLPCHFCGPCERGCSTGSYFSTQASTLPAARATGKLTVLPNSIVHSVIYDAAKTRVTGVRVVDAETKRTSEYYARVVFLCASTLGTTRLLLNSTSPRFPTGLANSSGALGHYLMDHHFLGGSGSVCRARTITWSSPTRPTISASPSSRSIAAGATTSSRCARTWPHRPRRCSKRRDARTSAPTTPTGAAGSSAPSPGSRSTRWARPAWGATRRPRC